MNPNFVLQTVGSKPLRFGLLVGILVFGFCIAVFNTAQPSLAQWYRLVVSGKEISAVVTRKSLELHRTCYFEYEVNQLKYQGADQGCGFEVGQKVTLKYLPSDPSFATSTSPIGELAFLSLGLFMIPIFGGGLAVLFASRYKSSIKNDRL